jgi:hypothetical protein
MAATRLMGTLGYGFRPAYPAIVGSVCVLFLLVSDRLSRLSQSDAGRWVELPTDFRSPGVAKG